MKYYVIAGEASGDLLGSHLMREIKNLDPQADFCCWGGDLMEAEGGQINKHYKDLAFMGFWEVATHLRTILKNLQICKLEILLYEPDVIILIDYPGFNMRIAEFARENNIRVVYYVSPQIWAWKKKRIHKIIRDVDTLLTILPFEKEIYARHGYEAHYVGHPLLDVITPEVLEDKTSNFRLKHNINNVKPIIAILPGSRTQEIKRILPVMLQVIEQFPDCQFVISKVKWLPQSLYDKYLKNKSVKIIEGDTYEILKNAKAALVTSGTATLETAILNIPQVVCYKTSALSYAIARVLVGKSIRFISLVNLIANKQIVSELLQSECNASAISKELSLLLNDSETISKMDADYKELRQILGNSGASRRAAELVVKNNFF